jgi:class 3 adenylate cyclase/tetratricopeptide (TPR) repeat protein
MTGELASGATFGCYRIEDIVGRGGMGVVYRATDLELERLVALKLIAPELAGNERFRERFLRESRLAASLDHPNLVPIHEAGEQDGRFYIAMRYVDGEDLRGVLARERTLTPEWALAIAGQIADALDAAHERGLVHRDVKPGNVLLDRAGHAFLCDFGLSKQTGGESTLTGQLLGTLDYLAPEQIRGESVDRRSDQYALACLLYECLAGQPPFHRETEAETLWAHMQEEPPLVEQYPDLDGVFRRALAKPKDERYTSCRDLVAATRAAIEGKTAVARPVVREVRKTVSAVFVGLLIMSEGGGSLDPEALRRVTADAFADVEAAVERYGGTVESFAGDSVTAIFGLPVVYEDDAVRAIRAAAEIQHRLVSIAQQLADERSMRFEFGIGVSSGEAVIGSGTMPQLRTTGEPLTISSRLGHAAAENAEVILDERTRRLARGAVVVEPTQVGSLAAFRLIEAVDVGADQPGRFESPIVGRDRERRRLHDAFEQAVGDRSCQLFTVLGAAGVGKSRLVHAFIEKVSSEARVAHGRCLPYGEGITHWPVREAVKELARLADTNSAQEVQAKLEALLVGEDDAELIAQRVAETVGLIDAAIGTEESFLAVRTFFEAIARRRPLVLVFDDIQWGAATFLDLIEYVTDWAREAPILLVCLTRPELLDLRTGWAGGKLNATTVLLEPLSEEESAQLVDNIAGAAVLDDSARRRVVEAAEGNPLFVEEMLALVLEGGGTEGGLVMPPSIQALLTARLDQLPDEERTVIEAASVEGKVFHQGSIAALVSNAGGSIQGHLMALVRKELVRPSRPLFSGEHCFVFRHLLIRDAAYESIPKEARAAYHERHAEWLEGKAGERLAEYEEIVGYHLEQAHRYRAELGRTGEAQRAIGRQAAERLGAAGRRACDRSDAPAAVNLLSRAVALLPPEDPTRVDLVPAVRIAQGLGGDLGWAFEVLDEAIAAGTERVRTHALVQRGLLRLFTGPDVAATELTEIAEHAIVVFEELDDQLGLARAWRLVEQANYLARRAGASVDAAEEALRYARRADDRFEEREIEQFLLVALILGPAPAGSAIGRCTQLLAEAAGDPVLEVHALGALTYFLSVQGRDAEAQELLARRKGAGGELGTSLSVVPPVYFGVYALWEDDPAGADRELRPAYEALGRIGEKSHFSSLTTVLAQALYGQGRYDEAVALAMEARDAARTIDVQCQTITRTVMAKVLARRGNFAEAEALAGEAISFVAESDFLPVHAEALMDMAEICRLAGRGSDARTAVKQALRLHEQKENLVGAARARSLLGSLV